MILVVFSLSGLLIGVSKNDFRWRVLCDVSNMLIMGILDIIFAVQAKIILCFICGVFLAINLMSLLSNISELRRQLKEKNMKVNNIDDTSGVLKEFIKEIEEYGSTRH
jgi:ABC-type multidrug transport system fused ATPase/permease subunit